MSLTITLPARRRAPAAGSILTALYVAAAVVGAVRGTSTATRCAALLPAIVSAVRIALAGRRLRRSRGPLGPRRR